MNEAIPGALASSWSPIVLRTISLNNTVTITLQIGSPHHTHHTTPKPPNEHPPRLMPSAHRAWLTPQWCEPTAPQW